MDEQQITLLLVRPDGTYDITNLVEQVEFSGRKGAAPRTVAVKFIDSSEYDRAGIDVEKGHSIIFYWNGEELFRGMVMRQIEKQDRMGDIKAYDLGRYLSNNRDSFNYKNKTLTDIFKDVCSRFQLPIGECASCSYKLDEISGLKTTAWDLLTDAMLETFKFTGERYYIYIDGEKVNLIKRKDSMITWVAETGQNIISYTRTRDYSEIKTRVKLLGEKDAVLHTETNSALESVFGMFMDVESVNKDVPKSKYKQLAQNKLNHDGKPDCYVEINAIGITDCITGATLHLKIDELGINEVYYIDEDTHTFAMNKKSDLGGFNHTMSLKLRLTDEIQG